MAGAPGDQDQMKRLADGEPFHFQKAEQMPPDYSAG